MPTKPAFMLATTVVGAATICAIAGCSSPNSGVGSAGVSMIAAPPATSGSGTTTSTTTPATAFGAPTPYPNAQPFAAANSALVVYVPDNPNPGTPSPQLVVSPASGYAFNITYGTRDNRPAASVSLNANIPNVRSIDTARLDQPLKQQ